MKTKNNNAINMNLFNKPQIVIQLELNIVKIVLNVNIWTYI